MASLIRNEPRECGGEEGNSDWLVHNSWKKNLSFTKNKFKKNNNRSFLFMSYVIVFAIIYGSLICLYQ